jgi:hypothetical protein
LKNRTSSDYRALWRAGPICRLLGVLMALNLPYTNYQAAYPDIRFHRNRKQKPNAKHSQPIWAYGCEAFEEDFGQKGVKVVPHKGTIKNGPIALGKRLRVAQPRSDDSTDTAEPEEVQVDSGYPAEYIQFPQSLFPFVRAAGGGIYYQPPPKTQKDGTQIQDPPSVLLPYDLVPLKRLHSPYDGECMFMRLFLPKDGTRDLVLPAKLIGATDKLKEFLFSNSIVLNDTKVALFKEYLMKWNNYLINLKKAEDMRMQMGWTSNPDYGSFVIGKREITPKGEFDCPVGPTTRNIAKHLVEEGSYDEWRKASKEFKPAWT